MKAISGKELETFYERCKALFKYATSKKGATYTFSFVFEAIMFILEIKFEYIFWLNFIVGIMITLVFNMEKMKRNLVYEELNKEREKSALMIKILQIIKIAKKYDNIEEIDKIFQGSETKFLSKKETDKIRKELGIE